MAIGNDAWMRPFPYCSVTYLLRVNCLKGNTTESLNFLTNNIKNWNHFVHDLIGIRKRKLMQRLSNVQRDLERVDSVHLSLLEAQIREELEYVLHHEELLWKQKARNYNKITVLKNEEGDWILKDESLQIEAINFFQKLYGEPPECSTALLASSFPKIDPNDKELLRKAFSN
ncbi:hypothetical protein J1N35_009547 [Gossypium stocksii]|uniref:Reverse transcriptase n=1 Tax=Gossypium stocksii TaxID=47602 RepID=A0A9D4AB03_9ROSI|nr:hypothetical protein J1N35_009547 [Gossypium stocksii]